MKNIILRSITLILLSICALTSVAVSAYAAKDFNIKNNTQNYFHVDGATGNIGIGTTTPQGAFVVTNGNVGIGTWATSNNMLNVRGRVGIGTTYASYYSAPANGLLIEGNTGIGTYAPSAALHVRSAGATTPLIVTSAFSSTTPIMSIDGVGNLIYGPTVSSGGSQSMIDFGNNVAATTGSADFFLINPSSNNTAGIFKVAKSSFSYFEIDTNGKVGIGTVSQGSLLSVLGGASLGVYARSAAPAGGLIASGNVGVGTIGPASKMAVVGNIGVGTGINSSYVTTAAPSGGMIIEGNVGLGTTTPQDKLIVLGGNVGIGTWTADNASLETTGLRLIGNGAAAGSVLVSSSTGIGTWMAPGTISSSAASGWSTGTGTVYNTTGSDNVGVGTTTPQGGFVVTNGNVGIGTWAPQSLLDVYGAGDAYFTTNVGIGSVNPTQALDVVGTGKFSVAVNAPAISNLTSNGFVKTSGGTGTLSVDTNTYPSYSSMTTNYLQKATSSSAVGNSSIFDNGNVGIGTTTPQGGLVVTNGNVGIGTWATVGGRFIVKGPGNVGIGTSMPESLLTVNGTSGIISDLTTNASQTSFFKGNYNGSNYFNILFGGSNEIQFSITDTVDNTNGNYFIQKSGETFGRAVFGRSFLAFGPGNTTRDAFIERSSSSTFRISSDQSTGAANLLVTGNLGLGTLTPSSKLTVAGGLGIGTGLNTQYVTTSAPTGGMIVEGNVGFGTTTPKAKLAVVGGNVGIGTWTADTASLETTGLRLIGNGAAAGSVLVSTSTGVGTWMAPGTISSSGAASGWSTGTGTVYNTTGSDNIGIGTTTPQGGLVVTNGNVGIGTWTANSLLQVGPQITTTALAGFTAIANIAGNVDAISGIEMRNLSSGVSADYRFLVSDNAHDAYLAFSMPSTANTGTLFGMTRSGVAGVFTNATTTGRILVLGTVTQNSTVLGTNNTERMRISSLGNVGIGTTTPQGGFVVTNGNVGIGTWAPVLNLDITGQFGVKPSSSGFPTSIAQGLGGRFYAVHPSNDWGFVVARASNDNGNGNLTLYHTRNSDASVNTALSNGDGLGRISFQGATGSSTVINGAEIQAIVNGTVSAGVLPTDLIIRTGNADVSNSSTYERMRITSAGNIGIGTASPQAKLSIVGGNVGIGTWTAATASLETTGLRLIGNGAAAGSVLVSTSTGIGTWMAPGTISSSGAASGWSTGTGTVYNTTGSDNVGIGTITPQGGLVVTNGNVGIGTWTTAGGNLIVMGNIGIGTSILTGYQLDIFDRHNAGNGSAIVMNLASSGASSGSGYGGIDINNTLGDNAFMNRFGVRASAYQYGLIGKSLGNNGSTMGSAAGWFTIPPAAVLGESTGTTTGSAIVGASDQITTSDLMQLLQGGSSFTGNGLTMSFGNQGSGGSFSGNFLNLKVNTVNKFVINSSGNIGIGTLTPVNAIDVVGGVGIGTGINTAFLTSSAPAGGMIVQGNVGLGTTTPQDKLIVVGGNVGIGTWTAATASLETTGLRLIGNGATAGSVLVSSSTGIGTWMAASTLATSGAASGWSTGTGTVYNTTGSDKVGIGTTTPQGGFVVTNGNVGIGTWAPQALLDVYGTSDTYFTTNVGIGSVNPTQSLDVVGTGKFSTGVNAPKLTNLTSNGFVKTGSGDGTLSVDTNTYPSYSSMTTNYLQKSTSSSAVGDSSIFDNGNVGIGTTTPQASFVVYGGGKVGIGTFAPYSLIQTQIQSAGSVTTLGVKNLTNGTGIAEFGGTSTGDVSGIRFYNADSTAFNSISLGFRHGQTIGQAGAPQGWFKAYLPSGTTSTEFGFLTSAAGYEALRIKASGNVGIGTIEPGSLLSVAGGVGIGTGPNTAYVSTAAPAGGMIIQGNVGIGTTTPQAGFVVYGDGNVGIGTWTAATASLETTGLRLIGNNAAAGSVLVSSSTGIGTWMAAGTLATSGAASGWSTGTGTVYNTTGSDKIGIGTTTPQGGLVVTNGNVGIGTWTAAAASLETTGLRLIGNNAAAGSVLVSSSTGIGTWMAASTLATGAAASGWSTGTGTVYNTTGSDKVGIGTTTPQGGLVITNGNVGIGTFAPTQLLDINGNIAASGTGDSYFLGSVGIGSSSPATALDVTGTVRSTAISAGSGGFTVDSSGNVTAVASTTTTGGYTQSGTSANTFTGTSTFSNATKSAIFTGGNVGVGTTTPQGAFVVTNGNVGIGTWAPNSTFTFRGSQSASLGTLAADTTLGTSQYTVLVDSTSSAITITLPTAVGITGRCYRIKDWKGQSAVNNINIATTSAQTIDGAASAIINVAYQGAEFCSDGANWSIF